MNKIVREHYPVSKLPEDLQQEFAGFDTVKIVTEDDADLTGVAAVEAAERKFQEYLRGMKRDAATEFGSHWNSVTVEEAVARVRELRDEWDD